jgi:hypothetical protein
MSDKNYKIKLDDDNSFSIVCEIIPNTIESETKDMVSFSLQYLYTVLNSDIMISSDSNKEKVKGVIDSFNFDENDIKEFTRLINKFGVKINEVMMTHENGLPKVWDDYSL